MAGRATLAYFGADDVMLVGSPEMTYFIERYRTSLPFAKRLEVLSFDTIVRFGAENSIQITKRGDLISNLYLKFSPPSMPVAFCDSVMTNMIEYVEFCYNGQTVERLYGEYIEMLFDITTSKGKQSTLQYLSGKVYPQTSSPINTEYTLPLPFNCLKKGLEIGDGYIELKVVLKKSSTFTIPVYEYTLPLNFQVLVEYVYIPYKLNRPIHLFEQVQRVEFIAASGVNNVRLQLGLMHPVKEIFVVIQNTGAFGFDFTTDGAFSGDLSTYTNGSPRQDRLRAGEGRRALAPP